MSDENKTPNQVNPEEAPKQPLSAGGGGHAGAQGGADQQGVPSSSSSSSSSSPSIAAASPSSSAADDVTKAREKVKSLEDVKLKIKARQLLGDGLFVAAVLDAEDDEELVVTVQAWKLPGGADESSSGHRLSANLLTLQDDQKRDIDQKTELKAYDVVYLAGRTTNQRDLDYAPGDCLFVTGGAITMFKWFWSGYNNRRLKEFCIKGAAGSGKSCAAQLLAADIHRKLPTAKVYHFRGWKSSDMSVVDDVIAQNTTAGVKTFIIADQIMEESDARALGALAAKVDVHVVMIASANVYHFDDDREGGQHNKETMCYLFASPPSDCLQLAQVVCPGKYKSVSLTFQPADKLDFESARAATTPTSLDAMCVWTNGHLLSLSKLLRKESAEAMVRATHKRMSAFFTGTSDTANKPPHTPFYLEVLKMFKNKRTSLTSTDLTDFDARYLGPKGNVLCPFFLQALERSLALGPPPPNFYNASLSELLNKNPSEVGFAVEREALQDKNLLTSGAACLKKLGEELKVPDSQITRMAFHDPRQIFDEVKTASLKSWDTWAVHAIPLKWNNKDIDVIQIYFSNGKLYVIGNSVTVQTGQDHAKSLAWIDQLNSLKTLNTASIPMSFILLFTAKQPDDGTELQVSSDRVSAANREDLTVMDYPVINVMGPSSKFYFQLNTNMRTYEARVLSLKEKKRKRKRVHQGCGCQKTKCETKACSCKKAGQLCNAQCRCANCENKK